MERHPVRQNLIMPEPKGLPALECYAAIGREAGSLPQPVVMAG